MTEAVPTEGPILVVDDQEPILDLVQSQLQLAGYAVLTASDGAAGAAHLEAHGPSIRLVVLDPKCPDTGQARLVMKTLRRLRPRLPVLVLSGDFQEEAYAQIDAPRLDDEFAIDFLKKPYDVAELEAKVAALLSA